MSTGEEEDVNRKGVDEGEEERLARRRRKQQPSPQRPPPPPTFSRPSPPPPLRLCRDVTDAIGGTPLVDLSRLARRYYASDDDDDGRSVDRGRILAKLEYLNPGYSKKDRVARQIVADAVESGELQPNQTVVELTSGNTGTGLAVVCGVLGYPFVAVMSKGNSPERARMMRALGAEVVLVDQAPGSVPGQVSGDDLALPHVASRIHRSRLRLLRFGKKSDTKGGNSYCGRGCGWSTGSYHFFEPEYARSIRTPRFGDTRSATRRELLRDKVATQVVRSAP